MSRPTQGEILAALIDDPDHPVLLRFDGTVFTPETVLEEVNRHHRSGMFCFSTDEFGPEDCEHRLIGPGHYSFFRYGWLKPVVPKLLQLPDGHAARLKPGATREVATAIAHVDRMFRAILYQGAWWLHLRDQEDPPSLVACDYYLFRRVLAMEELHSIVEAEGESGDEEEETFPLFIWPDSFGPETFGEPN